MENLELRATLDAYYREVSSNIVDKQNPVSGLLPASTAITTHGDYTDAWVRDNVYSILAVWGLGLAYRSLDDDDGRGRELEQRTVFLMRGLLRSMMAQATKVEAFKKTRTPLDALHAKYNTETGAQVVDDDAWGHLQIDATSVFLLQLAQMIASGLDLIWTLDEVDFIQNLIYYIERAYRTPDFGIWERGAKTNLGRVELNASSLGMAKAALEALDGFNLFGARGGHSSVIHVSPDNIAQAEITLSAMLPRESHTKEVDAAVLSVIGYPAFAVHDTTLRDSTRKEIISKLEGKYGLKRFLRDGHQTAVEDEERLHYESEELKLFEDIESEWPLFFTYLYLDALLRGDRPEAEKYGERLAQLVVERDGQKLLPELYYVPEDKVDAEKENPGSQRRTPNDNLPLVWAQSLYLLGRMIRDGVLEARDIDPLGRRRQRRMNPPVVQLLLLSEDEKLQAELAAHGVKTETLDDIEPFDAFLPEDIVRAHGQVGRNERLNLSGRASRALKSLSTSRLYELDHRKVVCLAPFFLQRDSYLSYDLSFLLARFRSELKYLSRHWSRPGRPTVALLLTHSLLAQERDEFYSLMQEAQAGAIDSVPVRAGHLVHLLPTASYERLDNMGSLQLPQTPVASALHPPHSLQRPENAQPLPIVTAREIESIEDSAELKRRLATTKNIFEQIELLSVLVAREGLEGRADFQETSTSFQELLEEVYEAAGQARLWSIVRRSAGLLNKVDVDLNLAVAAILVANKNIQVGRAYSHESLITAPLPDQELLRRVNEFCRDDVRDRILTEEVLLYLGLLIRARPELFRSLRTVRVSHMIGLIAGELA
ncbi:MAG: glycoside hydrolase family 15 protein, partial [Polyangiaceae bacterium]|nr:glycoside hydrolase family 15 protein [Polyangiaceae bacterium]